MLRKIIMDEDKALVMEHTGDHDEDFEEPNYIPDSWLDEKGRRHAVIFDESLPEYRRIEFINGEWKLIEDSPF